VAVFSFSSPEFLDQISTCNFCIASRTFVVINISSTKLSTNIRAYPFIFPNVRFPYLHTRHQNGAIKRTYSTNCSSFKLPTAPPPPRPSKAKNSETGTSEFHVYIRANQVSIFPILCRFEQFFLTWTCWVYFIVAEDQRALL
jgi:hypothetical protein